MWVEKSNKKLNYKKIILEKKRKQYYFIYENDIISPWHDIPYKLSNKTYLMVNEIPKWTRKKMEIQTDKKNNPIIQDKSDGKPREYVWGDMLFNYGAIPQTWEDTEYRYPSTGKFGDGDPIDIIDIGYKQRQIGEIIPVKILGVIPMIDSGETDWKIIAIATDDPMAKKINQLKDVKKFFPGLIEALFEWFEKYKIPTHNRINKFAFGKTAGTKKTAIKIIEEGYSHWLKLHNKDI